MVVIILFQKYYGLRYMKKKISDKFLSWGFKEKNKKVLPIGKFKNI